MAGKTGMVFPKFRATWVQVWGEPAESLGSQSPTIIRWVFENDRQPEAGKVNHTLW